MKAVQGFEGDVRLIDADVPDGPGELVRVHAVGICASDINYVNRGAQLILGHEISGFTADGTPVVIEGLSACGECEWCIQGRTNLCAFTGRNILGMTVDGGMSEFFRVPSCSIVPLPLGLRVDDAALVEPGAVAWHAVRSAGVGEHTRVAVVGGGAIGVMAVLAARQQGATDIALVARHPHQIELGERLGAPAPAGLYDVVIEASGAQSGLAMGFELARPRGVLASVSVYPADMDWPYRYAFLKEVRIVPSIGYDRHDGGVSELARVAEMLAARPDVVGSLITHRFDIEDAQEAFRVAKDKSKGAFRVVVHP